MFPHFHIIFALFVFYIYCLHSINSITIIESRDKIKPLNGDRNILKNIMQKVNIGKKQKIC